jgi:hypothetical protein
MLGYKLEEVTRMQEIVYYSAQDAQDNEDEESYKYLKMTADLLEGLIQEGHIK